MKLFLEVEDEEKKIVKVKEVVDKAEAIKDKDPVKNCYYHICYHDEGNGKPCKRVKL